MKVLITGAPGFVGRHMATDLLRAGHEVVLAGIASETIEIPDCGSHNVLKMDITNPDQCLKVLQKENPDSVIHLAGIAQTVGQSAEIFKAVNINGASQVAKATKTLSSSKPKSFLFVSSAFVYGADTPTGTVLCNETTPTAPRGLYGNSKLEAEKLVTSLSDKNFHVYIARPFNHIGPGQDLSFVVPGLATKIKSASSGATIETGNLTSLRDFTDVRDVVRAYRLIIEKRPNENTFVIGSGKATAIQTVFNYLNKLSGKNITTKIADHLKRDEGSSAILADITLAKKVLGWTPEIPLEQSLKDVWNER